MNRREGTEERREPLGKDLQNSPSPTDACMSTTTDSIIHSRSNYLNINNKAVPFRQLLEKFLFNRGVKKV